MLLAANLSTSATEMAFNGNDAVGLFKTEFD
jgi:phosphoenolpyruvate-protein kinase (PTS system EI component)